MWGMPTRLDSDSEIITRRTSSLTGLKKDQSNFGIYVDSFYATYVLTFCWYCITPCPRISKHQTSSSWFRGFQLSTYKRPRRPMNQMGISMIHFRGWHHQIPNCETGIPKCQADPRPGPSQKLHFQLRMVKVASPCASWANVFETNSVSKSSTNHHSVGRRVHIHMNSMMEQ